MSFLVEQYLLPRSHNNLIKLDSNLFQTQHKRARTARPLYTKDAIMVKTFAHQICLLAKKIKQDDELPRIKE